MIRGSTQSQEAVIAWAWSAIDDSPMTASKETMSRRHPGVLFIPTGNQMSAIVTEAVKIHEDRPSIGISEPEGVIVALIGHERYEEVLEPRRHFATWQTAS